MAHRVLFVQDDDALRKRVKDLLEASGFLVEATGSGLEAVVRASRNRPDVVLTDVHLSDIEGAELTARLRQEGSLSGLCIVAMGGSVDERGAVLAAGADGFVARNADEGLAGRLHDYLQGERERLSPEREREELRALTGRMAVRLEGALAGRRLAVGKLVETDRLKTTFIRNLAHELSTPLTPLAGYLRILQSERTGALTAQQKQVLESMSHAVGRLARILENLADFASLEAGHAPLVESRVNPDQLADEVVAEQRSTIRDARLHLQVRHSGAAAVLADARKLRQALANLVSNAVKFSPHGGEVLIEVVREEGWLRYAVYDQGPGIRADEQERLFEPMHHAAARSGGEARPPGSGLGLPVARRIAETHGGRAWVESPPRTQPVSIPQHYTGSKFVLEVAVRPADGTGEPGGAGSGTAAG